MRRDAARRRRLVRPAHLERARPDLRDRARARRRAAARGRLPLDRLDTESFTRRLAAWRSSSSSGSREHGRDLPWRRTRDPYAILVSEVMLQQTQVSRVVPRYLEWLERWPDVHALAAASTADVIRAWQGLGYNRRAVNLHRAARLVAEHGWPDDLTELPGVGPYTAAAVGNFAFGRAVLPVDVNIGARARAHRHGVLAGRGAGAVRPRRDRLPRARAALWGVPARSRLPFARSHLRAAAQAGAVRRIVPPATRRAAAARGGRGRSPPPPTRRRSPRCSPTGSSSSKTTSLGCLHDPLRRPDRRPSRGGAAATVPHRPSSRPTSTRSATRPTRSPTPTCRR